MKAIEIDGNIKTYTNIPQTWTDANGLHLNFTKAEHSDYGLYDVITPKYDYQSQKLGSLAFDKKKKIFTYDVIDIDFSGNDIQELKAERIIELKQMAGLELTSTDWYIVRKVERNIDIPESIVNKRLSILNKSDEFESDINALNSYVEVLQYSYSF